jgi:hypothetical protein
MSKFASARDEALYQLTLDGTAETIGDVSTWDSIYLGLGKLTRDELTTHHSSVLAETGASLSDFADGAFWIVREDDNGFVTIAEYASESEYRAALDDLETQWAAFEDAAD